ncbi:MAG: NAD(P)H-dependent oxidoreductase, partial [Promethearchaeota archaeon]
DTELINLYDYNIEDCIGCWSCSELGKCFKNDDFEHLFEKVKEADIIILGSPVYWGNISGIMKTFFDRHTGYAMYLPPNIDKAQELPIWKKLKVALRTMKNFGPRPEFGKKKFIFIISATIPFKHFMNDIKNTLKSLKIYVRKLNGTIIEKFIVTDSLFKFRKNKIKRIKEKALKIGEKL